MATGQINSYNMSWTDSALPAAQKVISKEQAAEAFGNVKMYSCSICCGKITLVSHKRRCWSIPLIIPPMD
jgi:hypothetical protein